MGLFRRRARPLTPAAANEALARGELLLVDVREPSEFAAGHAPGARNLPLDDVAAGLGALQAESRSLAFVCRSGMRSGAAVAAAGKAGVAAQNVRGGMLAWERSGLPVQRGGPSSNRTRTTSTGPQTS